MKKVKDVEQLKPWLPFFTLEDDCFLIDGRQFCLIDKKALLYNNEAKDDFIEEVLSMPVWID
ncbi:MAG TPA: hypothetical protein VFW62_02650 [bacterium]|nr:hypothetical protein [bacterium]